MGPEDRSLLYYEDPTGKVVALSQQDVGAAENQTIEWINVTSQESESLPDAFHNTPGSTAGGLLYSKTLYESLGTNTTLSIPFICGANWSGASVGAVFYSPRLDSSNATEFQFVIESYKNGAVDSGNFSQIPTANNGSELVFRTVIYELTSTVAYSSSSNLETDYSSIQLSDLALFGANNAIWVNHTQPTVVDSSYGTLPPDTAFPFSRLASTSVYGSTYTYLYHQMNGTTFAEEQWDDTEGAWTATDYITISF